MLTISLYCCNCTHCHNPSIITHSPLATKSNITHTSRWLVTFIASWQTLSRIYVDPLSFFSSLLVSISLFQFVGSAPVLSFCCLFRQFIALDIRFLATCDLIDVHSSSSVSILNLSFSMPPSLFLLLPLSRLTICPSHSRA